MSIVACPAGSSSNTDLPSETDVLNATQSDMPKSSTGYAFLCICMRVIPASSLCLQKFKRIKTGAFWLFDKSGVFDFLSGVNSPDLQGKYVRSATCEAIFAVLDEFPCVSIMTRSTLRCFDCMRRSGSVFG